MLFTGEYMNFQPAIQLIKKFEGLRLQAYKCPAQVWTIGYGYTIGVKQGDVITEQQAEDQVLQMVETIYKQIKPLIKVQLNDNQVNALIDFVYNLGIGNFKSSTLLKVLNQGNFQQASNQILRWNKSAGKVLPGLVKRRQAQRQLFLK